MNWFFDLFFGNASQWGGGVAHSVLILALVIAVGLILGKVKVAGISLGVTWILFAGIAFAHFGMKIDRQILHFMQEFGLILFVYSIGLQVGPGFFSSFKQGGIKLNMMALSIVMLGVATTLVLYKVTDLPITTMVGIMSGAVTNTPGLGAAQQAASEISGMDNPDIATGYAVAYPLAVVGIIVTMIVFRYIFRINLNKEEQLAMKTDSSQRDAVARELTLKLTNPSITGMTVGQTHDLINRNYVICRMRRKDGGEVKMVNAETVLHAGDDLQIITSPSAAPAIIAFLGEETEVEWYQLNAKLISRRILITKSELNGTSLSKLRLRSFGVSLTRVNRSGIDLVAQPSLKLQIGDRVTVVGTETAIGEVEKVLGNSLKRLDHPNLFPIFLGIVLGVILGSVPFIFPGVPQPIKLGLAGGPLIVSILISRFGPKYKLVTYTTMSANLMMREVGIALFLACVGLGAGDGFIDTVVNGGYKWIGYGVLITVVPLLIVGIIGRAILKVNYFTLTGLMAGSMTDPPALAYANESSGNDIPSISYATVYPLTMFLRVLCAQLMILFLI